jgi:WD40 repeat protein
MQRANLRDNGGGAVEDAVFTPDGARIITASSDPRMTRSRNPLGLIKPSLAPAHPIPFMPGRLWDGGGEMERFFSGEDSGFGGVEINPAGDRWLFREVARAITMEIRPLNHYSFSSRATRTGRARLWRLDSDHETLLEGHPGPLLVAAFSPAGDRIITADSAQVQLWDANGMEPIELPDANGRDWTGFCPDGRRVLAQDAEGYVAVWDAATAQALGRVETAGTNHWHAWFGSHENEIGTLTQEGLLRLVDFESGAVLWESRASGPISGQAKVSPEARWLAAVVGEQSVDLWDLSQPKPVRTIERHVHEITALSFSPDEQWLGTGDRAGNVWLWPLRLAEE